MGCIASSHITPNKNDDGVKPLMMRKLSNGVYGIGANDSFCFGIGNNHTQKLIHSLTRLCPNIQNDADNQTSYRITISNVQGGTGYTFFSNINPVLYNSMCTTSQSRLTLQEKQTYIYVAGNNLHGH